VVGAVTVGGVVDGSEDVIEYELTLVGGVPVVVVPNVMV